MKIRGIYIKGIECGLDDISLDFRRESGGVHQCSLIHGLNGSGKSYLLDSVSQCWGACVLEKRHSDMPFISDMFRVDFDIGTRIVSLHMRRGNLDKSRTLSEVCEQNFKTNSFRNCVIYYDRNRSGLAYTYGGIKNPSTSTTSVYATLYDMHHRDVRDSVILIDDWDMGLDKESAYSYYREITKNAGSKGNQVILTSSREPDNHIDKDTVIRLTGRQDPIKKALAGS
jgi:hypothetical protein